MSGLGLVIFRTATYLPLAAFFSLSALRKYQPMEEAGTAMSKRLQLLGIPVNTGEAFSLINIQSHLPALIEDSSRFFFII